MSIFPRLNQRTKILLPIRTNLATYNEIPEHTVISANTGIPSVQDGPTVVAKYRNLTINAGCTLTTQYRCCGLALIVDGDLTVNGTISMTARGANLQPPSDHRLTNELLPGKEVYYEIDIPATADEIAAFLLKEKRRYHSLDDLPAIYRPTLYARGPRGNVYAQATLASIPAVGGAGGVGRASAGLGAAGTAGTDRKCGGGGAGGKSGANGGSSGNGAAGTCYSGGSGGGGVNNAYTGANAVAYGGAGGPAKGSVDLGGGAGNPGGAGVGSGSAGGNGTGGLLVIICTGLVTVNGTISANGVAGGNNSASGYAAGGGSGGGSINVFYGSLTNNGSIVATGGAGGVSQTTSVNGGAGGAGCVTLDQYNF